MKKNQIISALSLTGFLFLIFLTAADAQKSVSETFKTIAIPPGEILNKRMPDARLAGVKSKTSLIPVYKQDDLREIVIPIEKSEKYKLVFFSPRKDKWKLNAAFDNQSFTDLRLAALSGFTKRVDSSLGIEGNQFPSEGYEFTDLPAGELRLKLDLPDETKETTNKPIGYIMAGTASPFVLYSSIDTFKLVVGSKIGLSAILYDQKENDGNNNQPTLPRALQNSINEARLVVLTPDERKLEYTMTDAGDGSFRTDFVPDKPGTYMTQITVKGVNPLGEDFIRTSENVIKVSGIRAEILESPQTILAEDSNWNLSFSAKGLSVGQQVIYNTEVWGKDSSGQYVPVTRLSGMTLAEKSDKKGVANIPFALNSNWIALGKAVRNFELRNVTLQDPDSSIIVATKSKLDLPNLFLPGIVKSSFNGDISEEMLQGKRPEREPSRFARQSVMLVHGYCSSNVFPTWQYSGEIIFGDDDNDDDKRNRSHHMFAKAIKEYGEFRDATFGIVAHSQGGAAALELYTYFWSGLDWSSGGKKIQSVGTPYGGTPLAGIIALIGLIFGESCGPNFDLTSLGSMIWQWGIPGWARSQVSFYTTSFEDKWWRWDYCHWASDLILSDPDDGTVELFPSLLWGGNFMGHTEGQCHTNGMRDMAQYRDGGRNSTMNALTAR
jgi:hypothetical protein